MVFHVRGEEVHPFSSKALPVGSRGARPALGHGHQEGGHQAAGSSVAVGVHTGGCICRCEAQLAGGALTWVKDRAILFPEDKGCVSQPLMPVPVHLAGQPWTSYLTSLCFIVLLWEMELGLEDLEKDLTRQ